MSAWDQVQLLANLRLDDGDIFSNVNNEHSDRTEQTWRHIGSDVRIGVNASDYAGSENRQRIICRIRSRS